MKTFIHLIALFSMSSLALVSDAADPDCGGVDSWVTNMSLAYLKNQGVTDSETLDFTRTNVIRLASKDIGNKLYRQVYLIEFAETSGNKIKVISMHDAGDEECSMSDVQVFVLSAEVDCIIPGNP